MQKSSEAHVIQSDPNKACTSSTQAEQTNSPLDNFVKSVKATYTKKHFMMQEDDPSNREREVKFINLALIEKMKLSGKERDTFYKDAIHGSVDDIETKMIKIETYSEIFKYPSTDKRKLILVQGSPGVGKTVLARQICRDWANGEILSEYNAVILVNLREFQGEISPTLKDIFGAYGEFTELSGISCDRRGSGILFILEGWDELPPELRCVKSIFFKIIRGYNLPECSVMVTSRPTAIDTLCRYMQERRVEVLGFNSCQIAEYVQKNSDKAQLVLGHLQNFPNLKALAHIPLTLSIICEVSETANGLPSTLTELYEIYILRAFYKHMIKNGNKHNIVSLDSLADLPSEYKEVIKQLGMVALSGLKERKLVFLDPPSSQDRDGCGLLTVFDSSAKAGRKDLYQFQHLSLQEYLAANHIHQLAPSDRLTLLNDHRDDKQFLNTWKFYAGITKLEDQEFLDAILSTTGKSNTSQNFLIHCLYEAHTSKICKLAANVLNWKLNLNNMNLIATDCLCAAYVVTTVGGQWYLDLRNCNIGADGLEIFKQYMTDSKAKGVFGFK